MCLHNLELYDIFSIRNYRTMKPLEYIKHLNNRGIWSFTRKDASKFLSKEVTATIRTLKKENRIVDPSRGFYVIVPEEMSLVNRLPGDRFIDDLMNHLKAPYYVCLLSAAFYHGSSHQSPQVFQVMTLQQRRDILVRGNKIVFHQKKSVDDTPTVKLNTPTGYMNVSTPEATVLDLIQFNKHIGGMDYAATVISEMMERISIMKLIKALNAYPVPVWQRTGYVFDYLGKKSGLEQLHQCVMKEKPIYTPLAVTGDKGREPKDSRWKVIVNHSIELDI